MDYIDRINEKSVKSRGKTVNEIIYEILREDILHCVMVPGQKIIENELSKTMNVSRTPIRNAIEVLLKEGLLLRNGKGVFVSALSKNDILKILEVRSSMEPYATKLAAERRTQKDIDDLTEFTNMLIEDKNRSGYYDYKFHWTIYSATKNKYFCIMQNLLDMSFFRMHYYQDQVGPLYDSAERYYQEHKNILTPIINQDGKESFEKARMHIKYIVTLHTLVEKNGENQPSEAE
jgi:DNA-binding GntR family transcriptional regulator